MAATDFVTESQIDALSAAIATRANSQKNATGDLSALSTTAKTSLVAALNEVAASIPDPGAAINDTATSTSSVWSSSKTSGEISSAVSASISALTSGAPAALDTLDELAAALGDNASFSATITTALSNRLRFDAAQTLTTGQKAQALSNLGIAASTSDFASTFTAAVA